ncbi:MAG: DUF2182 domain-containing protein [Micropruina sp.]
MNAGLHRLRRTELVATGVSTSSTSDNRRLQNVPPHWSPRSTTPPVELVETPSRRPQLRDRLNHHPEWLALLLAAAAWIGLALTLGWLGPAGWALPSGHHHSPDAAVPHVHSVDTQLLTWALMVVAMMLPTTVPHLRHLGFNTRRSRRQRSLALFTLGYLAVWLAPGLLFAVAPSPVPTSVLAVLLLAAGAWELTPIKRRALRGCCRTLPTGFTGPSADAAAVDYGLRHGYSCLLVGGPAMAVLMLAGHPWWATVALAVVMATQKLLSRPDQWRAVVALSWLASGLAIAGVAWLDAA